MYNSCLLRAVPRDLTSQHNSLRTAELLTTWWLQASQMSTAFQETKGSCIARYDVASEITKCSGWNSHRSPPSFRGGKHQPHLLKGVSKRNCKKAMWVRDNVVEIFGKYNLPQDISCFPWGYEKLDCLIKLKAKDKLYTKIPRTQYFPHSSLYQHHFPSWLLQPSIYYWLRSSRSPML